MPRTLGAAVRNVNNVVIAVVNLLQYLRFLDLTVSSAHHIDGDLGKPSNGYKPGA